MTVEIINPATGQVTYRHELMDAAAIEQRLQAAAEAFPRWAERSLQDRGAILKQIAGQLRARRDDLQQAMTSEMGKLKAEALAEVEKCATTCEFYADHAADYLKPQLIDTEAQRSYVRYEPIGCVFAVMPWNFPIWQVFRFLAPAFMAGNVALLKHASNVPQCADLILAVCRDGGLPDGVFDVLHIDNDQAADVLRDARVKAVTLT
ncbi:aldehyde dehydrogenase family protein, partial [Stenotrophomonas sp. 2YAF22]